MGAYWMDEGEVDVLNIYLKNQSQHSYLYLGLFTDPAEGSLTEDMSLGDLTEPTEESGGYGRIALAPAGWTISGSSAYQDYQTFDIATQISARGYFITDLESGISGGNLLAVVYFSAVVTVDVGEQLKVKPTITVS